MQKLLELFGNELKITLVIYLQQSYSIREYYVISHT